MPTRSRFLVAPGAPATLAGTLTTTDVDVFRFTATITGTTAVNLTRTGGPNQPLDLRIIDGDLQEIRRGTQSGTAELVRTFDTIAGRTYYIRVARGSELDTTAQTYRIDVSQIEAVIVEDTPLLDDRAQRSLQRDVDESVSEGIAETTSFRTGEQSGTKTADARINEILLEKFLNYFGGIEAFSEPVLFIWFDPIDFVVTDPGSREVGFTDARGTVNQVGKGVSYSGNGATEWLVVPAAQAGSYALQLVGVGSSQYRFGANFISSSGVQSVTSTGTLLKGDATVVLDFSRKGTGEGGGGGGGGGGGRGGGGFAGIAQDVAAVLRPGTTLAFGGSGGGGGGGGGGRGAIGGDGLFSVSDTPVVVAWGHKARPREWVARGADRVPAGYSARSPGPCPNRSRPSRGGAACRACLRPRKKRSPTSGPRWGADWCRSPACRCRMCPPSRT